MLLSRYGEQKQAIKWFTRAAERNHDGALYWLGDIYLNGRGVPYDRIKANHYLEAAAGAGNIDARRILVFITEKEQELLTLLTLEDLYTVLNRPQWPVISIQCA